MRFYQVTFQNSSDGSKGFHYFTSMEQARRASRAFLAENKNDPRAIAEVDVIEISPTRAGILSALNLLASHPDNG